MGGAQGSKTEKFANPFFGSSSDCLGCFWDPVDLNSSSLTNYHQLIEAEVDKMADKVADMVADMTADNFFSFLV